MFAIADQYHDLLVRRTSMDLIFFLWSHVKQLIYTEDIPDDVT